MHMDHTSAAQAHGQDFFLAVPLTHERWSELFFFLCLIESDRNFFGTNVP